VKRVSSGRKVAWLILIPISLFMLFPTGVIGQDQGGRGEQCINISAGRIIGIGGWFVHNETGFCAKYWTSETTGIEACFLAPLGGGGRLSFLAKAQNKLMDTCYIDGYLALGAEIPLGDEINWQRFDGSVGVEWSFPDLPQFAISLEIGLSVSHYCCGPSWAPCQDWCWASGTFTAMGFHYYF
jgi:hypothetical protein